MRILSGATLLASCGVPKTAPSSQVQAIIGANDLVIETSPELRRQVGQLILGGYSCTAFVTAKREVTTAAHCLRSDANTQLSQAQFISADGQSTTVSRIVQIDVKKDYLVLATEENLAGVPLTFGPLQDQKLKLVGFDDNKGQLYTNVNCLVEHRVPRSGTFTHSCDTIAGMSGSPLLQDGKVVGIHLGYQEKLDRNVAFETALLRDGSVDVAVVGIEQEHGLHVRGTPHIRVPVTPPHVRNILPVPQFGSWKDALVKQLADGATGLVRSQAHLWNKDTCVAAVAAPILGYISTAEGTICGVLGAASIGVGAGACLAWAGSNQATIDAAVDIATCQQLCAQHALSDCQ